MKTLLLMRHGKSSWKHPELPDHERPLAKTGLQDAHRMGELIEHRELIPQRILSSTAVRAAETAKIFCKMCGCGDTITLTDALYLAEAETYIEQLNDLPNELDRVMLIGHNPGLEALLQILCARIESLPTAVIAYIQLPISSWAELSSDTEGELVEIWRPKELPEEKGGKKKKKDKKDGKDKHAAEEKDKKSDKKKDEKKKEKKKDEDKKDKPKKDKKD